MALGKQTPQAFPTSFTPREKESGIGLRPGAEHGVYKLWEDDEITEISKSTTLIPASARTETRPRLTIMTGVRSGEVVSLDAATEFTIGRSRTAHLRLDEQGVSRAHCRLTRGADGGFRVEDLGSMNGTLVNGVRVDSACVRPGDRIQIGACTILHFGLIDDAEETLARRLFEASTRDALTGAFNRRYFTERLETEVAYARRHKTVLAVMLLDIDFFKRVNDTCGHGAGDEVLQEVVAGLQRCVRAEDLVARYGGEEFALLVRVDSMEAAGIFAERIRSHIQSLGIRFCAEILKVTVSVGVAELGECAANAGVADFLGLADRRLYRAKLLGRNRVCSG